MNPYNIWADVGNRPFLSPHKDKISQPKCPGGRRFKKLFPVDVKKHPVSLLHEYCSMQHVSPSFIFYEIPQSIGIEYGCIVTVENFSGEGQSFSKKTAKQQAAANLLWKLTQPDYVGDPDNSTKRFVSETGVISVHYEGDIDSSKRRSCFKSSNSPAARRVKKKVQWQDSSDGDSEVDEATSESQTNLPPTDSDSEEDLSYKEDIATKEENSSNKSTSILLKNKIKKEFEDPQNDKKSPPSVLGEIEDYLSQRLLKANIDELEATSKNTRNDTSDEEIQEIKFNDEPRRKKKKVSPSFTDAALLLKRKVFLRERNPVGYLQEACQCFKIPLPTYIQLKEHGFYKIICILDDHKEQATGINPKEVKKAAASQMIEYQGW